MRRLIIAVILSALAALLTLLGMGPAAAVPTPDGQIGNVRGTLGHLQFVFTAGSLPAGANLDPKSVVVSVDGKTLDATAKLVAAANRQADTPLREVVLALDVSGSMAGDGISAARAAASSYVSHLPPDVRVGLVTFADKATVVLRPTRDRAKLASAISKVQAGGDTALYDGVIAAARLMQGLPSSSDRRLLILSDGDDTASRHSIADATSAMVSNHVSGDVVAFRLPGDHKALEQIAAASQGKVLPANSADSLAEVFTAAAQEFHQQMLVTVKVPQSLANATATMTVALNAGGQSIRVSSEVTFPNVATSGGGDRLAVSQPTVVVSKLGLWVTVAVAFIGLLAIMLVVLFVPVLRHERAQKEARIAEMLRYRVVGVAGAVGPQMGQPATQEQQRSAITERALALADTTLRARGRRQNVASELDRAGLRIRPEEWAVIQVLIVVFAAALVGILTRNVFGAIVGGGVGWAGVRIFIRWKMNQRSAAFEQQLPDTLQLLAGSLRSGFSLNQALTSVVRQGNEPTASEFARTLTEVRLGANLEDALDDTADRMRCEDLHWVVIAIRIAREVGGNLAEVLTTTMYTMRERVELRGQVRVLSAEGRLSARILTGLPFFILGYFAIINPKYIHPLFHTGFGIGMLLFGAVLLSVGSFWLSRLVNIKV
jgi:tight adherence protein B